MVEGRPTGKLSAATTASHGVVSVLAVGVLAVDCVGLSGMVSPRVESSGLAVRSKRGSIDPGVSTHHTAAARTTTPEPEAATPEKKAPSADQRQEPPGQKSSKSEPREAASPTMSF